MLKQKNQKNNKPRYWTSIWGWVLFLCLNPLFSFSEEIRYQSGDRRDPFVPVTRNVIASSPVEGIQVEGIVFDSHGKSMVIIHGEPYKVGDSIGEQKIVAIHPSKIVVDVKGVETEYWISSAEQQISETKK